MQYEFCIILNVKGQTCEKKIHKLGTVLRKLLRNNIEQERCLYKIYLHTRYEISGKTIGIITQIR